MPSSRVADVDWLALANNPAITAHINVLQGVINRLANASLQCKTWALTLVGAFLSLAGAMHNAALIDFVPLPLLVFGYVDARYLAQERAYRSLYNYIATQVRSGSYPRDQLFLADASAYRGFPLALSSWSIWPVYGVLLLAYAAGRYFHLFSALTTASK